MTFRPGTQYRVELLTKPTRKGETVVVYKFSPEDQPGGIYYNGVEDLPKWIQERIAVLTVAGCDVEGVGDFLHGNVFWVDV